MPTQFPSALDQFVSPTAGSKMDALPHSAQHANANDAIQALEAKVGINGTSVQTTHEYKLSAIIAPEKAVASDDARLTDERTPTAHNHDSSYFTEAEVTALLSGKADSAHTHAGLPVFARVSGSNASTTGQALVDVTGLTLALLANSVYEFEAILSVQASSTAGNQYGVQFSAAGATIEAQISGTLAAATSRSDRISALNTAAPALVTSGSTGGVRIKGIIAVGANAGNLTIKHLKVTSGTSTVFINSFLKATKI